MSEIAMKSNPDRLWTIDDVAKFCQVKPSVVRYWCANSDIPYLKLGKHLRFTGEDVREWVEKKAHRTHWDLSSLRDV